MAKQIKPSEAEQLCNNYDAKFNALTKMIGKDDNRSCSLSIAELENYLSYIKESNNSIDGIRIYLGSNSQSDLTTMFIVPTSKNVDNTELKVLDRINNGVPPKKKYTK